MPDARRLSLDWGENKIQAGAMALLRRVVFYGDHTAAIRELGDLMGCKVIEESGVAQIPEFTVSAAGRIAPARPD